MSTCYNCEAELNALLYDMPSLWREGIVKALCKYEQELQEVKDCEQLKNCQTVSQLFPWEITGENVCISYKNESGNIQKKCFNVLDLFGDSLDSINFGCEVDAQTWASYTFAEKIQKIIDVICERVPTTTTTTSTTTTSSTTTTTTIPCPVPVNIVLQELTTTSTTTTTTIPPSTTTTTTVAGTTTTTTSTSTTTTTTVPPSTTTTTTAPIIVGYVDFDTAPSGSPYQYIPRVKVTFTQPLVGNMSTKVGFDYLPSGGSLLSLGYPTPRTNGSPYDDATCTLLFNASAGDIGPKITTSPCLGTEFNYDMKKIVFFDVVIPAGYTLQLLPAPSRPGLTIEVR